jgi:hypothetical protein
MPTPTCHKASRSRCSFRQRTIARSSSSFRACYVNLARRTDRRQRIESLLRDLMTKEHFERFEALDGAELFQSGQLSSVCRGAVAASVFSSPTLQCGWVMGGEFTPGAVALCATTQRILLEHHRRHPQERVPLLILEDDVQLAPGLQPAAVGQLLQHLSSSRRGGGDDDWDILLLGSVRQLVSIPRPPGLTPPRASMPPKPSSRLAC